MGDISLDGISALDAVTNTFAVLSKEQDPRKRSDDSERELDVGAVRRVGDQVEALCQLGVRGYISKLSLEALDVPALRTHGDVEWFDLRVAFAASRTARAGILLVEGVGNFGIVSHVSELIKLGIRENIPGVTVRIEPIQDAASWGETFAALTTQALEFRTFIDSSDVATQATGGKSIPLSKIIKVTRRGGLGPYRSIMGKSVQNIADAFGVGSDIDDKTWAVATLASPDNRKRKINVEENRVSSISFPIQRAALSRPPTDDELYATCAQVVDDVRIGVGLQNVVVSALDSASGVATVTEPTTDEWKVPDEVASSQGSGGSA